MTVQTSNRSISQSITELNNWTSFTRVSNANEDSVTHVINNVHVTWEPTCDFWYRVCVKKPATAHKPVSLSSGLNLVSGTSRQLLGGLGLGLESTGISLQITVLYTSVCDGKSYFPSLHVTDSLDPMLPHCFVAGLQATAGLTCVAVTIGVVVLRSWSWSVSRWLETTSGWSWSWQWRSWS